MGCINPSNSKHIFREKYKFYSSTNDPLNSNRIFYKIKQKNTRKRCIFEINEKHLKLKPKTTAVNLFYGTFTLLRCAKEKYKVPALNLVETETNVKLGGEILT